MRSLESAACACPLLAFINVSQREDQPLSCKCPLMAQSRHAQCADECPLLGAKRTLTNRCLPISIYEYTPKIVFKNPASPTSFYLHDCIDGWEAIPIRLTALLSASAIGAP